MSAPTFDAAAFKDQQRTNWNDLSGGWDRWYELFETGAAPLTDRLLADATPGHHVLDLGSGTGQPALDAAHRVGPDGAVTGVDQAGDMLAVARRRAGQLKLDNVAFTEADAERLDFPAASFDIVTSRFTLMLLPDPRAVLTSCLRLLRPGGTLSASVWGPAPQVPVLSLAFGIVAARLELPPPPAGLPGPFAMADPSGLTELLGELGFTDVTVEEVPLAFRPASAAEFTAFSWDLLPQWLRAKLADRFGDERDTRTWDAVQSAAGEFAVEEANGGLRVPGVSHLVRAVKPHA